MKITHAGIVANIDSYSTIWAIEDAVSKELDEAFAEYDLAMALTKKAKTEHEKNWAKVEEARAKMKYLEKYAIYMDFMKGF